jgi:hypothetical protein
MKVSAFPGRLAGHEVCGAEPDRNLLQDR